MIQKHWSLPLPINPTWLPALLAATLSACASNPMQAEFIPGDGIKAQYVHGNPVLESNQVNAVNLTVLEASGDALLLAIGVTNRTASNFDFGPANVRVRAAITETQVETSNGRVYRYDEVAASRDNSLAWDSANIVTGAVAPSVVGNGIGGLVLRGFFSLGMNSARRSAESKNRPPAQAYLRRHTLVPEATQQGILKVGLPQPVTLPQLIIVSVTTPADNHQFEYRLDN